jgi:hypothetical protein
MKVGLNFLSIHSNKKLKLTFSLKDDPLALDAFDIAMIRNEIKHQKEMRILKNQQYQANRKSMQDTGYITDRDLQEVAENIQLERIYKTITPFPRKGESLKIVL